MANAIVSESTLASIQFLICKDVVSQLLARTEYTERRLMWSWPIQCWRDAEYPGLWTDKAGDLHFAAFKRGFYFEGTPIHNSAWFTIELHDFIRQRKYDQFAQDFGSITKGHILEDLRKIQPAVDESILKAFEEL